MIGGVFKPAMYATFNIVSVVAIVVVNKAVFSTVGFHFPTLLVCIHCVVTHLGLRAACAYGAFEAKVFERRSLVVLALSFIGYNVLSLANLNVNTVGFYQITKIIATPATMLLEASCMGKSFSSDTLAAVGIMCVGVGFATVSDLGGGLFGGVLALMAAFGAAQSYIFIGKTQRDLKASSNQLLLAYTPYTAAMLFVLSPIDSLLPQKGGASTALEWAQTEMTAFKVIFILFSGCIGLVVSLSTFLLIRETSPLTYNIVGHAKTISILIAGVLTFGDEIGSQKALGIILALSGMVWYGQIKLRLKAEQEKEKNVAMKPIAVGSGGEKVAAVESGLLGVDGSAESKKKLLKLQEELEMTHASIGSYAEKLFQSFFGKFGAA